MRPLRFHIGKLTAENPLCCDLSGSKMVATNELIISKA